jgi:hypothetical protein
MAISTLRSTRRLPDGTPLHNRLLAALPAADYARIQKHLHMNTGVTGRTLQEHGTPVTDVYFPNGGVFSVTNEMRDGALVEVATVGVEGMLGIGVFLGDRSGAGRIFQQVPDGPFASMTVSRFVKESATPGPFHDVLALYAQANLLQIVQGTACNALHGVKQRCCRWLLQTQDRVGSREFLLKHEFSRHHAGCAASNGYARHGDITRRRAHQDSVRTNSGAEEEEARTGRMRV